MIDNSIYHTKEYGIFSNIFFKFILIFTGVIAFTSVILLKATTVDQYWRDPYLVVYTVLVTTFELSRVFGAMFYNYSYKKMLKQKKSFDPNGIFEPTVSFVIPCKNEEKSIGKTIEKCFESHYPKEKLEVIVINDGSTDKTEEVLRQMKLRHESLVVENWSVNKGKRHAMATGFKLAKGEIIVQLDSDSYIVPSTFRHLIEPFAHPEIGAVCAHADPENAGKNWLTKMQSAYYFMSFRILKAAESSFMLVFCCSGCSSAYRKDIVLPILDTWLGEKFLGLPVTWGDDRSLTNWVLKLGYNTVYTSNARAYTICPERLRQFIKQQVRWKKGWFVNSIFASKFIYRREPFIAFTYFFPLIAVTLITPFMAFKAFVYNPVFLNIPPYLYMAGVFLVAIIITLYYRHVSRRHKYWPYVFVWSAINMVFLSFILFYALFTIQNRKWGTR